MSVADQFRTNFLCLLWFYKTICFDHATHDICYRLGKLYLFHSLSQYKNQHLYNNHLIMLFFKIIKY
ncbi:hypothetical protein I4U23_018168 [Adineta vaga]|nr:hypothetical protein I4U23_018168 [Adineta vaga]